MDAQLWHIVEAKRDDGMPTMFRIREIERRPQLTRIFVVELPYPTTELSRLPSAADYRRLAEFDEQWLRPACAALGWEVVGHKIEDGSFFLYVYGAGDPNAMIEKLSPFDAGLGFYDDEDPEWQEYATLRELLDQAKAIAPAEPPTASAQTQFASSGRPRLKPSAKRNAAGKSKAHAKPQAATKTRAHAEPKPRAKAAAEAKTKPRAKPARATRARAKATAAARKRR
jgi:hypothetical protein